MLALCEKKLGSSVEDLAIRKVNSAIWFEIGDIWRWEVTNYLVETQNIVDNWQAMWAGGGKETLEMGMYGPEGW